MTGHVGPFSGTGKTVGKNFVPDTPIPNSVSFPITGLEGSLTAEMNGQRQSDTVSGTQKCS